MKKGFLAYTLVVIVVSLLAVTVADAYPASSYSMSTDWATSTATAWAGKWVRQLYNFGYNANATGKLYLNDGVNIRIASSATGALQLTGPGFPTPSSFDRLSSQPVAKVLGFYFAVGQADDGALFATELNLDQSILYRWANDGVVATSQTVAGQMFARGLKVRGGGVNTTIYVVGGNDNDKAQIETTGDGVNFAVADTIPAPFAKTDIGVKNATPVTTVFGVQPWGTSSRDIATSGWPDRWDKIASVWTRSTAFTPPLAIPGSLSSYSEGGDWIKVDSADPRYAGNGGLLCYWTYTVAQTTDKHRGGIVVVKDDTGTEEAARYYWGRPDLGINMSYYGDLCVDTVNRDLYWGGRKGSTAGAPQGFGHYGRVTLTYIGSGVSDWELY
jgi:hypothetical protein